MDILQFGALGNLPVWAITLVSAFVVLAPLYLGARLWLTAPLWFAAAWTFAMPWWLMVPVFAPMLVLLVTPLRRGLLSDRLLDLFVRSGFMPPLMACRVIASRSALRPTMPFRVPCSGMVS